MEQALGSTRAWVESFTLTDLLGLGITALVTLAVVLILRQGFPALMSRLSWRLGWEYEETIWPRLVGPLWLLVALLGGWALAVRMPVPAEAADRY